MKKLEKRIAYITNQFTSLSDNNIPFSIEVYERTNKPYESMFVEETHNGNYFTDWIDNELYYNSFEYHYWNFSTLTKSINDYENKAIHLQCTYLDVTDCECHIDTLFYFNKNGAIDIVTHDYYSQSYGHTVVTFPYKLGIKAFMKDFIKEYDFCKNS